jgi:hypothetical protein
VFVCSHVCSPKMIAYQLNLISESLHLELSRKLNSGSYRSDEPSDIMKLVSKSIACLKKVSSYMTKYDAIKIYSGHWNK